MMNSQTTITASQVELSAQMLDDGRIYITSSTWPGFRYLLSGEEGMHAALTDFQAAMERARAV